MFCVQCSSFQHTLRARFFVLFCDNLKFFTNILSFSIFCTVFMLNILFLVINSFFMYIALTDYNEHRTMDFNFSFCLWPDIEFFWLVLTHHEKKNARKSFSVWRAGRFNWISRKLEQFYSHSRFNLQSQNCSFIPLWLVQ